MERLELPLDSEQSLRNDDTSSEIDSNSFTNSPASKNKKASIEERVSNLPEELRAKLEKLSVEGNVEEFFRNLNEYEISVTEQQEYASFFMQEFKKGLEMIAWTKERLMYTAAILEHTLSSDNPNPSSGENMIRNYLIFCKIFEGKEGKLPRFGQFNYVIRGIFGKITSREDIYRVIQDHKTFGEVDITEEEVQEFSQRHFSDIEKVNQEFSDKMEKSATRLQSIKESLPEETKNEGASKSFVWSPSFSNPREYVFPHYEFQTGNRIGLNTAVGRSSWEPMFLAYMDVTNKRLEETIQKKDELTEEEKLKTIRERRIELLYEQFNFPVGIKKGEDGKDKFIVYIPDFIDINRWGVTEIKGPLTPKAQEKIRAFQKYYIEQDYSDLPEDQKIIMMRCVQDKIAEMQKWCKQHGYPVRDSFSYYHIFGVHRWDKDLNNFNSYEAVNDMPGVKEETKASLQRGLITFIEQQIKAGKCPDIRPEGYASTSQLPTIVETNKRQALASKKEYAVEKTCQTKPFMPELFVKTMNIHEMNNIEINRTLVQYVLDTLPIPPEVKSRIWDINEAHITLGYISKRIDDIPLKKYWPQLEAGYKLEIQSSQNGYDIGGVIQKLKIIRAELLKKKKKGEIKVKNENHFGKQTNRLKRLIEEHENIFNSERNNVAVNIDYFLRPNPEIEAKKETDATIENIDEFVQKIYLGKYFSLFDDRLFKLLNLLVQNRDVSEIEKELQSYTEKDKIIPTEFDRVCGSLTLKLIKGADQYEMLKPIISALIYLRESTNFMLTSFRINQLTDELYLKYTNPNSLFHILKSIGGIEITTDHKEILDLLYLNRNRSEIQIEEAMKLRETLLVKKKLLIDILEALLMNELKDKNSEFTKNLEKEINSETIKKIKENLVKI